MNLTRSFVEYMQNELFGVFGTDIFIGGAPQKAPDTCWWVVSSGGNSVIKNKTNEKLKAYVLDIFYRSDNAEDVYDTLEALEKRLNSDDCPELTDFEVVEFEATLFPIDQDLDVQDRTVGLLQATLTIYA